MTENEAIEVLSNELIVIANMIGYCKDFEKESDLALAYRVKRKEAHIIAISALKEIQLYKDNKLCLIPEDVYSRQCSELDAYKEIGTVEECRGAVDKHTRDDGTLDDDISVILEEVETGFDKEKVINELREELNSSDAEKDRCARENPLQFDSAKGYANGIANAIEIVEKGGIE